MRYYVMTDLHGFYTLFRQALQEAGYEEDPGEKRILLLGDLFDRGPENAEMQEGILRLMEEDRVILLRGNHEDLFEELVTRDRGRPLRHHVHNGTYDTLQTLTGIRADYSWDGNMLLAKAGRETPFYTQIIPAMLDYFETKNYIFTHAWIPCNYSDGKAVYDLHWREADASAWREARWINPMEAAKTARCPGKSVVCGHFHTSYGHSRMEGIGTEFGPDADFSPYQAPGVLALDACTAYSRRMNCVVLED